LTGRECVSDFLLHDAAAAYWRGQTEPAVFALAAALGLNWVLALRRDAAQMQWNAVQVQSRVVTMLPQEPVYA
jgi:hypothetical protein